MVTIGTISNLSYMVEYMFIIYSKYYYIES